MKDGNYYTVYGWMINQLKLKGTAVRSDLWLFRKR